MNEEFVDQQETAPEDGQPEPLEAEKFDTLPKPPQPDEGDGQADVSQAWEGVDRG
jgi:hypothetical protein